MRRSHIPAPQWEERKPLVRASLLPQAWHSKPESLPDAQQGRLPKYPRGKCPLGDKEGKKMTWAPLFHWDKGHLLLEYEKEKKQPIETCSKNYIHLFFFKCKRKKQYSSKNQKKIEDSPDAGVGTHPQKTWGSMWTLLDHCRNFLYILKL